MNWFLHDFRVLRGFVAMTLFVKTKPISKNENEHKYIQNKELCKFERFHAAKNKANLIVQRSSFRVLRMEFEKTKPICRRSK